MIVSHVPGVGSSVHAEADDELYWHVTFVECQSHPWTYGRCLTLPVSSSGPTWPCSHTARPCLSYLFTGNAAFQQLTFCHNLMLVMFEPSVLLTKPIRHTRDKGPNSKETCSPPRKPSMWSFFYFLLRPKLNSPLEPGGDASLQTCI